MRGGREGAEGAKIVFRFSLWVQDGNKYNKYTLDLILMLVNLILHSGANASVLEKRKAKICECFEGERRKLSMDFQVFVREGVSSSSNNFSPDEWVGEDGRGVRSKASAAPLSNIHNVCVLAQQQNTREGICRWHSQRTLFPQPTTIIFCVCSYVWFIHGDWTNTRNVLSKGKQIFMNVFSFSEARAKKSGSKKQKFNSPLGNKLFFLVHVIFGLGLP